MCAILFTTSTNIKKEAFISALGEMTHRGPDAPLCYYEHENYKLGHNRLRILDLNERSNQPFVSADGRYLIIYNGEVYNYRELARQYSILMRTNSDTELILELSIKYGFDNALSKFNGMFAYVIFDMQNRSFFVARDRLGVKPLYYHESGGCYIFSSEICAITNLLNNHVSPDMTALRQYRKLRTFFNGHTIYNEIKMFPAGSYMYSDIDIKKWWELPIDEQFPPSDEELRDLITSAVEYRKISDVPVGCLLSGGIDSTIVAALTKEAHTWVVGLEYQNEFNYGRLAADKIRSIHHEITVSNESFIETTKKMITKRREPLSWPNEVLLYELSKKIKDVNTVVLCGEGADELFGGYDRIYKWAHNNKNFDIREFAKLWYPYSSCDDVEIVESAVEPFYKYGNTESIVAAFIQNVHLQGLLRRLDNSTMLCAVETRVPFVDYRLVERMAGVPYAYRMYGNTAKAPIKRIFRDIVPEEIIQRPKIGFQVDVGRIFDVAQEHAYDFWIDFNLKILELE